MKSGSPRGKAVDWDGLYDRLARAAGATRETAAPSRARTERILAERAKALATPLGDKDQPRRMLQVLTFTLEGERFGLETRNVRAVGGRPDITLVPSSPNYLVGVTSFRGEILAVFDVRVLLAGARQDLAERSRVIFLGKDRIEFGILADSVEEILEIPADEVTPRPWQGDGATSGGVTPTAISVLDADALIADQRLIIDHTGSTEAGVRGEA